MKWTISVDLTQLYRLEMHRQELRVAIASLIKRPYNGEQVADGMAHTNEGSHYLINQIEQ